eukprot:CAMPEP_0183315878 /NCGR_PEP_ID=MMETSP0160_2-20130417/53094_1 /TAXON_ID=2839 ORGANISM="Odontella Sinensis, Strain Grunow 1884" /NCGR_SAMPLE_ID=MMETSP0160_2 /ASSEMBLY_ACC=CAM_ASM_000250 /LENGTH=707 /DNA_ID=CAMNT_0025481549 /DNA_START=352 /DNA_END=2472 /DNA_ORIENTATION=+
MGTRGSGRCSAKPRQRRRLPLILAAALARPSPSGAFQLAPSPASPAPRRACPSCQTSRRDRSAPPNCASPLRPTSRRIPVALFVSQQESSAASASSSPSEDGKQEPLFDLSLVNDSATAFVVSDMSDKQRLDQEDDDGDDEGGTDGIVGYYDEENDTYNYGTDMSIEDVVDIADADLTTAAAAQVASDGAVWETYARDSDDLLTEREDRLYMDEDGRARKIERCILVGVEDLGAKRRKAKQERIGPINPEEDQVYFSLDESLTEMRELVKTAGLELACELTQRMNEPNPRTYIGTGKVQEAKEMLLENGCSTVVFDIELTPGQQKGLENAFNKKILQNDFMGAENEAEIKVVDRTALILDIFAQHAKTREGKLQVDLALHEYRKPRLTRMWTHLERQSGAGGVGLRGPGESQLEIDKRLLRDRIIVLKQKIDDVQKQRDLHRKGRSNTGLPILALVGYTNAGKSTLLNYLTRAGVMAENILFATLDPTTRRVKLPGYKTHPEVLLTDTVGFIQKLPTHLVAAFRATLEEVREADVLVHVVDVSNPVWRKQEQSVLRVLTEIGAGDKPIVRVLNKIDMLDRDEAEFARMEMAEENNGVAVSSLTGEGMEDFVTVTEEALSGLLVPIELEIPYSKGDEMHLIHEVGAVEEVDYRESGTYVRGRVPRAVAMRLEDYSVKVDEVSAHPMAERMKAIRSRNRGGKDDGGEEW